MPRYPSDVIMSAAHVHGVRTEEDYRAFHKRALRNLKIANPVMNPDDQPWTSTETPTVVIDSGTWKIHCATDGCNNYPAVHESGIACCIDCGAVYEHLEIPEPEEGVVPMILRRHVLRRVWNPGESAVQIATENLILKLPPVTVEEIAMASQMGIPVQQKPRKSK